MSQFGGKDSKRHFTVVIGGKEHGLYVSSTPSSAAKKAVTKLCSANKSKKVQFEIREITQGSKKKTYGPYEGHIEKLKEPIELKGRVIKYKSVAKLSGKSGVKKGGMRGGMKQFHTEISVNSKEIAELIKKELQESFKDNISVNIDLDENIYYLMITTNLWEKDYKYLEDLSKKVDKKIEEIFTGKPERFEIVKIWDIINA
jgi:hypothetical protein